MSQINIFNKNWTLPSKETAIKALLGCGIVVTACYISYKYFSNKIRRDQVRNINKRYIKLPVVNQHMKKKISVLGKYTGLLFTQYNEQIEIFIKDPDEFKDKLVQMKKDGLEQLQIVSDFDYTVTSFKINQKKTPTIFGSFQDSDKISQKFKDGYAALHKIYSPIEIDPHLDFNEKDAKMIEWYEKGAELYIGENLTKGSILKIINDSNIGVRYGFDRFLYICKVLNIPFYLVSGGMSEIIATIMTRCVDLKTYQNFFIFSNQLYFDDFDRLYQMDMHVVATRKNKILNNQQFTFKKNTLVFGDLLTDCDVAHQCGERQLTVGFLNELKRDDHLNSYRLKFDVVIVGEGSFIVADYLLRYIGGLPEDMEFREKMQEQQAYKDLMSLIEGELYMQHMEKSSSRIFIA